MRPIYNVACFVIKVNTFLIFFDELSDNIFMQVKGFTINELATILNISYKAAQKRLERAGIKPLLTEDVFPESALDAIKDSPGKGRPKKKSD